MYYALDFLSNIFFILLNWIKWCVFSFYFNCYNECIETTDTSPSSSSILFCSILKFVRLIFKVKYLFFGIYFCFFVFYLEIFLDIVALHFHFLMLCLCVCFLFFSNAFQERKKKLFLFKQLMECVQNKNLIYSFYKVFRIHNNEDANASKWYVLSCVCFLFVLYFFSFCVSCKQRTKLNILKLRMDKAETKWTHKPSQTIEPLLVYTRTKKQLM